MCSWTSKYAILRDLSEAQGHVPSEINGTVGTEPPPALELTEETEEEYYQSYTGEGDRVVTAPNLGLIKEMLDMVNAAYYNSPELGDGEAGANIVKIKRLNPECPEFVPSTAKQSNSENGTSPKPDLIQEQENRRKPKRVRNVAVASLLEALNENGVKNTLKLMKPEDFIDNNVSDTVKKNIVSDLIQKDIVSDSVQKYTSSESVQKHTVSESVQKVDGWLESQKQNGITSKKPPNLTPGLVMFKRKNNTVKGDIQPQTSASPRNDKYTPSILATEYYKKYVEKAKLNEKIKDIWMKTELLMKEVDAKKKEELAARSNDETSVETQKPDKLDIVRLPQHRHLLTGECIVCKTMCERKLDLSVL